MHNRFDQFIKRLAREAYSPGGHVETEAEVTPPARRIDIWFVPHAGRARKVLAPLGLFGRMGRTSCTLEPYHSTPTGDQVADCFAKHRFFCCDLARRKPRPPVPTQWIISSGRPSAALTGLNFRNSRQCKGIYDGPALMRTKVVVVSELPRTRDTLLVRLMGAGTTLRRAIADVRALPEDALERRLALPILVHLRLEIPADPAKQTTIDREFLMTTKEIDKYLEQIHEEGRKEGRDEGLAEGVLMAYRARFGAAPPAALAAAVEHADDRAALQRWMEMVTTRSADDVTAALRRPTAAKRTTGTTKRRGVSARRATAAR